MKLTPEEQETLHAAIKKELYIIAVKRAAKTYSEDDLILFEANRIAGELYKLYNL